MQRQARSEGKDGDGIWGEGLTDADLAPWVVSTMAMTTEIKSLLPEQGTKWLFMRVTTKSLLNDRMDSEIILLDEHGKLVALSHHVQQVIPTESKSAKKKSVL